MAYQLPSNIGAFFAATESPVGTLHTFAATDAVRVIGTPSFKVRGASIIADRNSFTPQGGGIQVVTGGLGWDISFQTEFYMPNPSSFNTNKLAALFRASQIGIDEANSPVVITPTAGFNLSHNRAAATDIQPCSLMWQETGGKQYAASGCVGKWKISASAGDRVMIDWEFKGQWVDVADSTDIAPNYGVYQTPVIYQSGSLTNGLGSGTLFSLSQFSFDPGLKLDDWADANQTHGFAIGGSSFAESPTLEITVADSTETNAPTWTDAQDNYAGDWTLAFTAGARTFTLVLTDGQQSAFPEVTEVSSYRAQKLKIAAPAPTDQTSTAPQYTLTLS
jgi:hypothetical protein